MKLPSLLLIGSLAVNAAVLTLYFTKSPATGDAPASVSAQNSAAGSAAGTTPLAGKTAAGAAAAGATANDPLKLAATELQTGDLKTLVARLKAAGFSTSLIRSIVAAQVSEQFSARRKELLGQQEEQPFWKNQRLGMMDPKAMAAMRELGKEQTALMKSLLGPDGMPGSEEMNAWQRRQFGNLAPEKLTQLQSIQSDYSELQQDIYAKINGIMLPEDREKLAFLEKEKLADIAKTLTPQEFEDYQLRSSNTAQQLRSQLSGFNASEAEFRALFKVAAAVDEKYGTSAMGGPRNPTDYQSRQAELLAQAQTVLSPERFADYKLATDPQSQQVSRLVARLELPPATTQQVVALQQDIQNRARAIQTNRELPAADRTAQLTALQQEATTKLSTTLTPRGLEAYKQNGGYWLEGLKPRPMPTAPGAAGGSGTLAPATRLPGG